MLEKLAKQTAVYGISTIAVRFLSYLLTPVFTRVFEPEAYGIVTDVYALIPFALVVLTMGLESAYFRFAAKADAAAAAAGGTEGEIAARARAGKRRLFATAWGVTLLAASLFFLLTAFGRERVAEWMGEAYVAHPEYVLLVAAVVWFDVAACLPFSRLREQSRAMTFVGIKALGVVVNVALAIGFALAGLYGTPFGVGWVFVANLIASAVTFNVILLTTDRTVPRIEYSRCGMAPGWNVKYKKGGRALCTLYPAAGSFTCLVCIGQREAMAAEALLPLCSPPVRQLYHTASPLNGSRWLMIPVTDEAVLTDVKALIGIRAAA